MRRSVYLGSRRVVALSSSSSLSFRFSRNQKCWYRGESGQGESRLLSEKERKLQAVAASKAAEIMKRHVRLVCLQDIPASSWSKEQQEQEEETELTVRQKRLVYRSKQRGWLEVDLLLGTWASENVANLSLLELDELEDLVNTETIDIYNIVTLRTDILPPHLEDNSVVAKIQNWAKHSPLGKADPATYKTVKTENNLI